jgi:hypothetical protein
MAIIKITGEDSNPGSCCEILMPCSFALFSEKAALLVLEAALIFK